MLFLFGFTGNSINVAINTQAVDLGKLMKKPIMASFHGMWSLAGFGGAALGAVMIAYNLNLELHYGLVLAINLIVSLWAFSSLLHIKPTEEEKNAPTFVWPDKSLLLLGIIALCSMLIEGTMFDWSGVYFKKVVHAPTQWVGLGYVAFMISMAGVRFVADKVTAVYGSKRIIMLSGICSLVGLLLVILLPHFYITIIGFFIIGIGVSAVIPLVFDMAGNTQRMLPSIALASVSTMGFFGFLVGPPIIGFLAEALGLQISFSFIAFMALLVIILASRLKRP
jgi:MFS family permease